MYCAIRNFNEYDFSGDLTKIGEYIYPYNGTDLLDKLEITKSNAKSVVFKYIGIPTKEDLEDMSSLGEARDNVKIMFCGVTALLNTPKNIKYFYGWGAMNADSLDKLNALIQLGVSDVYVSGQLGFDMQKVRTLADRKGVIVRICPNIAQTSGVGYIMELDNLTAFWVRPEDLYLYEPFVDIVEFVCYDDKQATFYDIYFQDKSWFGNLAEIIQGIETLDSRGLTPNFTAFRLDCGKKCILDKCHSCYKFAATSKIIVENNLEIKIEESI